jgi:hypothetical protein
MKHIIIEGRRMEWYWWILIIIGGVISTFAFVFLLILIMLKLDK